MLGRNDGFRFVGPDEFVFVGRIFVFGHKRPYDSRNVRLSFLARWRYDFRHDFLAADAEHKRPYDSRNVSAFSLARRPDFRRDKDAKWYREAKAFEDEYDKTLDEISGLRGQKRTPKEPFKPYKPEFGLPIIAFIFCLIPPLTLIDIFFVIKYSKDKAEYKKKLAEYEANIKRYETVDKPEAEKLNRELDDRIAAKETRLAEIRTAADNAINA